MKENARLIVIVAPSGTGKSSLIKKLHVEFKELSWSVSMTTRRKRINEIEGVDYFFVDQDTFNQGIHHNRFVEWAKVHGNYYGTPREFVERGIEQGKVLLFDLDIQGADAMIKDYAEFTKAIFIAPPSLKALEDRLINRGTEDEETIKRRTQNAIVELQRKNDYEYLVINDDFDKAYKDLSSIIKEILNSRREN
jgi:guanylate kinase